MATGLRTMGSWAKQRTSYPAGTVILARASSGVGQTVVAAARSPSSSFPAAKLTAGTRQSEPKRRKAVFMRDFAYAMLNRRLAHMFWESADGPPKVAGFKFKRKAAVPPSDKAGMFGFWDPSLFAVRKHQIHCAFRRPRACSATHAKEASRQDQQATDSLPADPEDHHQDREKAGWSIHRVLEQRQRQCVPQRRGCVLRGAQGTRAAEATLSLHQVQRREWAGRA